MSSCPRSICLMDHKDFLPKSVSLIHLKKTVLWVTLVWAMLNIFSRSPMHTTTPPHRTCTSKISRRSNNLTIKVRARRTRKSTTVVEVVKEWTGRLELTDVPSRFCSVCLTLEP